MMLTIYQKSTKKELFASKSFKEIKNYLYRLFNTSVHDVDCSFDDFMNDFIIK